jgi:hypothetical protein
MCSCGTLLCKDRSRLVYVSLVASRRETSEESPRHSYKIAPGPPLGHSYAREIAAQYGISYDQLTALLQQREVLE